MKTFDRWQKSKVEKYCEKWFLDNNFTIRGVKPYMTKTNYIVYKDNIECVFELPYAVADIKLYMKMFAESFEMKQKLMERIKEMSNER